MVDDWSIFDDGPSPFTLTEQIAEVQREIAHRYEILGLSERILSDAAKKYADEGLPFRLHVERVDFIRGTDCLCAALRTLEAMIDDGK